MSNYVWNKVICRRDVLEQYFIDPDPFGDGQLVDPPYITFNRLFGVKSLKEYSKSYGIHISYGNDFLWETRPDGLVEIKFTTRWQYPIRAILKVLELAHDTVWCAVEENHSYASKFLWQDGPKEFICALGDAYFDWDDAHPEFYRAFQTQTIARGIFSRKPNLLGKTGPARTNSKDIWTWPLCTSRCPSIKQFC